MAISADYTGASLTFGIGDFVNGSYSNSGTFNFTHSSDSDTVTSTWIEHGSDGSAFEYHDTFLNLPFVFAGGQGADTWKFAIDSNFFAAHVGTTIEFHVVLQASDGSSFSFNVDEFLQPFSATKIQNDSFGILRHDWETASDVASFIDHSQTTEADFVNHLLDMVQNTTIPAVAVEGSMYDHVGSSKEIDNLVLNFLPAQVATAAQFGFNQQVYACEVLGLAFAVGDENGGTGFATSYGPGNASMPNTDGGDASFASVASIKIFGAAANANTPDAIAGFVANWKAFYTDNGIPAFSIPRRTKSISSPAALHGAMRWASHWPTISVSCRRSPSISSKMPRSKLRSILPH